MVSCAIFATFLLLAIIRHFVIGNVIQMWCSYVLIQKYTVDQIRPWIFQSRKNGTFRPTFFGLEHYLDKTVTEAQVP